MFSRWKIGLTSVSFLRITCLLLDPETWLVQSPLLLEANTHWWNIIYHDTRVYIYTHTFYIHIIFIYIYNYVYTCQCIVCIFFCDIIYIYDIIGWNPTISTGNSSGSPTAETHCRLGFSEFNRRQLAVNIAANMAGWIPQWC